MPLFIPFAIRTYVCYNVALYRAVRVLKNPRKSYKTKCLLHRVAKDTIEYFAVFFRSVGDASGCRCFVFRIKLT